MNKVPLYEKLKVFSVNLVREFVNFSYYLFWLLIDPRKFVKINPKKIKSILVVCGGAIGDIYNVLGSINSVIEKYSTKVYLLTFEKNHRFVKNSKIKTINLSSAKRLIDLKKIDAAVLIDIARSRDLIDKEMFFKLLKVPYVASTDSLKLHPKKIKRQFFPMLASRKIFPVRANGPKTFINLFSLLHLKTNGLSFYFTKEGESFADSFLKKNLKKNEGFVIFHPGAAKITRALKERKIPAHLWPEDRWAKLIDKFTSEENMRAIITGVESEEVITKKIYNLIKNKNKVLYCVGKIPDVESLASIVRKANATVTMDTSMAHITTQVGTPGVIIYSSDSPRRIGPDSQNNINIYHEDKAHNCRRYACKYCHEIHMKSITVDEVYSSLKKLIGL